MSGLTPCGSKATRRASSSVHVRDVAVLERVAGRKPRERAPVEPVLRAPGRGRRRLRAHAHEVAAARGERGVGEPHERGLELVTDAGAADGGGDQVALLERQLVVELERDRLAAERLVELAVVGDEPPNPALAPARQDHDPVAGRGLAADDGADEAGRGRGRRGRTLDPQAKRRIRLVRRRRLELLEQGRALIPREPRAAGEHVVPVEARYGDAGHVFDAGKLGQLGGLSRERAVAVGRVAGQVELGRGEHDPAHAEQRRHGAVAARGCGQALPGVQGDERQRGGWRGGHERLRVALVAGRVHDREPAARAGELPVGHPEQQVLGGRIGKRALLRAL